MFDAYTVKKVLPRLVIAAVLIQLSWDLFTGLMDVVNAIAWGLEGLIYIPFGGRGALNIEDVVTGLGIGNEAGTAGIFLGAAVGGGVALGLVGILSLAVTVFISLLIAFFVLSLRVIVLAALLVISPIAIVAWILPNTDGLWKLWWESYSKLLLMYPLILLLFAVGRVFADVAGQVATNDAVAFILTVVAYFGPLFLIPKTFQVAGSAFANITGMVNDKSRGVFDRLKKGRQQRVAQNWDSTKKGARFSDNNPLSRRFNTVSGGLASGRKGHFGLGDQGREAARLRRTTNANEAMKENAALQLLTQTNDDGTAMLGLSGGTKQGLNEASAQLQQHWYKQELASGNHASDRDARAAAKVRADKAEAAAKSVGLSRANAEAAYNGLAQNKARSISPGNMELIGEGARRLGAGDQDAEDAIRQTFEYHARGAGRFDLGDDKGAKAGWNRGSLYQTGNAHPSTISGAHNEFLEDLQSGTEDEQQKAAVFYEELKTMRPGTTGQARDEIDKALAAVEGSGGQPGVLDQYYSSGGTVVEDQYGEVSVPGPNGTTTTRRTIVGQQPVSARKKAAQNSARTYERPEPEVQNQQAQPPQGP